MRRLLGSTAALLLASCPLAACAGGSDAGGSAASPTSQPDSGYVVSDELVSQTAGDGEIAQVATPLPDQAAVDDFTRGLADSLAAKVDEAVRRTQVASGQQLYGQVVAVGCDVPPAVTVERDPVAVQPEPVTSPKQECFAPVTTVALVVVLD
ncbi:hypothetical protein GCM10009798_41570 [Nocardioides panacihumi]|uniref:Lipoprotein n=1 Tax=Nocardioides panacihumi TaxID=400774 RepID=A0ABN2RW62_9ACTN